MNTGLDVSDFVYQKKSWARFLHHLPEHVTGQLLGTFQMSTCSVPAQGTCRAVVSKGPEESSGRPSFPSPSPSYGGGREIE